MDPSPFDDADRAALEAEVDALALRQDIPLTEEEAAYAAAARSENTLRGYRSDWREWTAYCQRKHALPMPAQPEVITGYLVELASAGAKVGTMSRRLSALRFAHRLKGLPDPTRNARVIAVWEGIRRRHGAPPDQSKPLMPPELWDVLAACPRVKTWKRGKAPETSLGGARDRALLLVGFVGALRRSEIGALRIEDLSDHANGIVMAIPRSKTNQTGEEAELVALPLAANIDHCPVVALREWLEVSGITEGPVFQGVRVDNRPTGRRLDFESINTLVKQAVERAGIDPAGYSAHSLRAGFVTYAHLRGASDRAIAHQTRHTSLATLSQYVRISQVWTDNAVMQLGL